MNKYKFSIIVTFYNAESYVLDSLKKIKNIVNDNVEVIIIDDGSSDNTLSIINSFKIKNSTVISHRNSGVSFSRNVGLKKSSGKYVLFLDGDDWLDSNVIEYVDKYYNYNYDIIKFGFIFVYNTKNIDYKITNMTYEVEKNNYSEFFDTLLSTSKFNSVSNQFIKRDILIKNNITFKYGAKYAEDFSFNLELFSNIKSGLILEECLYYYFQNDLGTSLNLNKTNVLKCLDDTINIYIPSRLLYKSNNDIKYTQVLTRIYDEIINSYKKIYRINNIKYSEISNALNIIYKNPLFIELRHDIKKSKVNLKGFYEQVFYYKILPLFNFMIFLILKYRAIRRIK